MSALPVAPELVEPVSEWGRLDPRMIIVRPLNELLGLLPALFALVFLGNVETWRVVASVGAVVFVVSYGLFSWLTTKYRITDNRVELHKGVVFRQKRSIPRDRIRTVDLTAKLGHRLFGLSAVRVGTGQQERGAGEGALVLDAVTSAEADRLRQVLLHRAQTSVVQERDDGTTIAALDNRWYRYAPLTLSGLLSIGVVVGFGMNLAHEVNLRFSEVGILRAVFGWLSTAPLTTIIPVVAGLIIVLSVIASLVGYLLQNHGYRLSRHANGTVHVSRGLLTTRSVSIEEKRLRGVSLYEPILLRSGGGARLSAVTTGLTKGSNSSLLLPPAPRSEADRVAAEVLGDSPITASLTAHPVRARSRRLTRAIVPTVALTGILLILTLTAGWPEWLWVLAAVLVPAFVLVGLDRYRNLGHALTDRYLVARSGSLTRRTVALQRSGIIGWKLRRTLFQRRAGVFTLTAITAAGSGGYRVLDVGEGAGVELADLAVPGLLGQFLER
ncbi:PH domain-containing protein [Actinokineospora sp. NBRC 105648]|uniref:PH domain-containing protein n=1 Tax=Actinokineospora sp. NBRC 105648 TaxID=3032206 RepID=UPI0024A4DAC5|nr:PH domain-containing protein [Actinokineospora sp. NBRC 105648]GLZ37838.1 hypothetical protein Acsp05_14620 [Actinokineospora sp. NBRC 105648]